MHYFICGLHHASVSLYLTWVGSAVLVTKPCAKVSLGNFGCLCNEYWVCHLNFLNFEEQAVFGMSNIVVHVLS